MSKKRWILSILFVFPFSLIAAQQQWVTLEENSDGSGVKAWQAGIQSRYDFIESCNNQAAYEMVQAFTRARSLSRFYNVGSQGDQEDYAVADYVEELLYKSLEYDPSEGETYYVYTYLDRGNRGWYFQFRWSSGRWMTYSWYYRVR